MRLNSIIAPDFKFGENEIADLFKAVVLSNVHSGGGLKEIEEYFGYWDKLLPPCRSDTIMSNNTRKKNLKFGGVK